jgi:hypothetical protein
VAYFRRFLAAENDCTCCSVCLSQITGFELKY